MTKQEFVDAVAERADLSKRDAGAAVDACLGVIESTLQSGDDRACSSLKAGMMTDVRRACVMWRSGS